MKIEDGKLVLPDGTRLRIHQGNQEPAMTWLERAKSHPDTMSRVERPKKEKASQIPPGMYDIKFNLPKHDLKSNPIIWKAKSAIAIGIDPGVNTGVSVWDARQQHFTRIESMKIHEAFDLVKEYQRVFAGDVFVRFEDARLRDWFGTSDREKLQGAGSIKRDSKIWEDFLTDNGVHFEGSKPATGTTKMRSAPFARQIKWKSKTNEHGRDAALLVWGY